MTTKNMFMRNIDLVGEQTSYYTNTDDLYSDIG